MRSQKHLILLVLSTTLSACGEPKDLDESLSNNMYHQSLGALYASKLTEDHQAAEAWKHLGIGSLVGQKASSNRRKFNLLNSDDKIIGYIVVQKNIDSYEIELFSSTLKSIKVIEIKGSPEYQIIDVPTRKTYILNPRLVSDEETKRFLQSNQNSIIVMLNAYTHSLQSKLDKSANITSCAEMQKNINIKNQAMYGCYGEYQRGEAWAASKSWCCEKAKNDVNNLCSNTLCIGCCELLDCDAACGIGDYGCFCGMHGRKCST